MTTPANTTPGTEMISLAELLKQQLQESQTYMPDPQSKFIQAFMGQFTLPNGKKSPVIEAVILDFRRVYNYYKLAYNPAVKQTPTCMAIGREEALDMYPSENSPEPQCSTTCSECAQNQWGSGPGKGRRCKNTFRLAIIPPDAPEPKNLAMLTVPPTSLKAFDAYFRGLRTSDLMPAQIITRITFDRNVAYTKFEFHMLAPNPNLESFNAAYLEAQNMLTTEYGLRA